MEIDMTDQELIKHVQKSIYIGKKSASKLKATVLTIDGMLCHKSRHFLNAVCNMKDCRYLEIGSWKGGSFTAALYDNFNAHGVSIENFCKFDPMKVNETHLCKNVTTFLSKIDTKLIKEDCWSIDLSIFKNPFNIYLYDGGHTEIEQEKAFTYFNAILDNPFIAIVDDWNQPEVRRGTIKAFKTLGYKKLFEQVLSPKNFGRENWIYIAVIKKQ